jgi:hypothetical protein
MARELIRDFEALISGGREDLPVLRWADKQQIVFRLLDKEPATIGQLSIKIPDKELGQTVIDVTSYDNKATSFVDRFPSLASRVSKGGKLGVCAVEVLKREGDKFVPSKTPSLIAQSGTNFWALVQPYSSKLGDQAFNTAFEIKRKGTGRNTTYSLYKDESEIPTTTIKREAIEELYNTWLDQQEIFEKSWGEKLSKQGGPAEEALALEEPEMDDEEKEKLTADLFTALGGE